MLSIKQFQCFVWTFTFPYLFNDFVALYYTSEQNTFTSKDVNAAKCGDIYIVSAQRCRTEKLSSASKKM